MFKKVLRPFAKTKIRKFTTITVFVLLATVLTVYFAGEPAHAASLIGTSTSTVATESSDQRKTFYDNSNNLYWSFFYDGTNIAYYNSSNGSTWTSRGTVTGLSLSTEFSVWYVQSTTTVYIVYDDVNTGILANKGTLGATSISWGTAHNVDATHGLLFVYISRDGNGKLWVSYVDRNTPAFYAYQSTNADDISAWGSRQTIVTGASTDRFSGVTVPMSTAGNTMFVYTLSVSSSSTATIVGKLWSGSLGSAQTIDTLTYNLVQDGELSAVGSSSDQVHLAYQDMATGGQTGRIKYARYSSGAWGTPVSIDSTTSDSYPVISINNSHSDDLYIYWINSNTIFYKKGVSPYASGNWDVSSTTLVNTGTNTWVTGAYRDSGTSMFVQWIDNNGGHNVRFQTVSLNSPPNVPSTNLHASDCSGSVCATVTPRLQMVATDPDSDTIKYQALVYNTTANDGTNCTGSAITGSPFDQNSSGTGWDNGTTAYTSGVTATYTIQAGSALTRGNAYCWQAQGKDPSGSNSFGTKSSPSTFTVDSAPAAPTLVLPAASATNTSASPQFQLNSTDADSDVLQYKIRIYTTNTDCGTDTIASPTAANLVRDITQASSQTGWTGQNANSSLSYASGSMAQYFYQAPPLGSTTTYYWHGAAIDNVVPPGSNAYSAFSSCQSFTTGTHESKTGNNVKILNGSTILQ